MNGNASRQVARLVAYIRRADGKGGSFSVAKASVAVEPGKEEEAPSALAQAALRDIRRGGRDEIPALSSLLEIEITEEARISMSAMQEGREARQSYNMTEGVVHRGRDIQWMTLNQTITLFVEVEAVSRQQSEETESFLSRMIKPEGKNDNERGSS